MRPPKVDMVNEDLGKQQKVAIIHQVSPLWFLYLCLLMLHVTRPSSTWER